MSEPSSGVTTETAEPPPARDPEAVKASRSGRWLALGFASALAIGALVWVIRDRGTPATLATVEKLIAADRYGEASQMALEIAEKSPQNAYAWFAVARA